MKKSIHTFVTYALILSFGMSIYSSTAHSRSKPKIRIKDLAGKWVTVQLAVIPSTGLSFGDQKIPGGVSVSSTTLWKFRADGSCKRFGFSNIDGVGVELSIPLSSCNITLNRNGTGEIHVESPLAGQSVIRFIVITKNEIAATSGDSAVSAFTFKRQMLGHHDKDDGNYYDYEDDD